MSDGVETLTRFARALRTEGLEVGTGRAASFCRAAALLEPADLYWAGRATLVAGPDEIPAYDRVFRTFFGDETPTPAVRPRPRVLIEVRPAGRENPDEGDAGPEARPRPLAASSLELLRGKRFDRLTPRELEELRGAIAQLRPAVPLRRSRRRRPARTGEPDLRRVLRRSFRTGGEPVERAWRERRRRRRRLVFLLDVSGSMSAFSRALLVFAHAALRTDARFEAFAFGTRLTRVTHALAQADADEALRRAAAEVVDWDGGTRIGESLKAFLDRFGHGGLARGAVVVVCSDGLDVGDPELLREQAARLGRLAHRVVWLNPLKGTPGYEPLARGMAAALPHVDVFASGHDLASLEALADQLGRL